MIYLSLLHCCVANAKPGLEIKFKDWTKSSSYISSCWCESYDENAWKRQNSDSLQYHSVSTYTISLMTSASDIAHICPSKPWLCSVASSSKRPAARRHNCVLAPHTPILWQMASLPMTRFEKHDHGLLSLSYSLYFDRHKGITKFGAGDVREQSQLPLSWAPNCQPTRGGRSEPNSIDWHFSLLVWQKELSFQQL